MAATRKRRSHKPETTETKASKEDMLAGQLRMLGLSEPCRQYRFHPVRHWLFDFAWPDIRLAVEVEGGLWVRGRHNSPKGFIGDCEKYGEAAVLGWQVVRVPTDWIGLRDWQAAELVARTIRAMVQEASREEAAS